MAKEVTEEPKAKVECPDCGGTGLETNEKLCQTCKGSGSK